LVKILIHKIGALVPQHLICNYKFSSGRHLESHDYRDVLINYAAAVDSAADAVSFRDFTSVTRTVKWMAFREISSFPQNCVKFCNFPV